MQTVYWLVIFIVLLIIEIITMGLTTIWFALGGFPCFAGSDKACRGEIF